jgi:acetate kinase
VRRYGFHGLSYEYIASRLGEVAPEIAEGRVVVAHLGSGASMCAISAGKSLESTMGFTALDGLPMGARPGQIDPGVVLYLMNEKRMSAKEIEHFLYNECGLRGLSGASNDVRELLASSEPRAKLALECFVYRIALFTGMLATAMGGMDGFVFTAGIGENAPAIREAVVRHLSWLSLELDPAANANTLLIRAAKPGHDRLLLQVARSAPASIPWPYAAAASPPQLLLRCARSSRLSKVCCLICSRRSRGS